MGSSVKKMIKNDENEKNKINGFNYFNYFKYYNYHTKKILFLFKKQPANQGTAPFEFKQADS